MSSWYSWMTLGRHQKPSAEVVAVGDFEREHRASGRCLEDRRDAGGRTGHDQTVQISRREHGAVPSLQRCPDRGSEVDRPAFEPSRSTGADRSCRSDQPERYGSGRQVAVAVECLDVLVGGTARQPPSEPQNDCGGSEPDKRKPRLHPPVEVTGTSLSITSPYSARIIWRHSGVVPPTTLGVFLV